MNTHLKKNRVQKDYLLIFQEIFLFCEMLVQMVLWIANPADFKVIPHSVTRKITILKSEWIDMKLFGIGIKYYFVRSSFMFVFAKSLGSCFFLDTL